MKTLKCGTSSCGLCRFYTPMGRRGGHCEQLSVPVRAGWKACCLAVSPFAEVTNEIEGITTWSKSLSVSSSTLRALTSDVSVVL